MSNQMQPRIRGQAYQKEDNAWSWEAVVTFGDMAVDDPEAIIIGNKNASFINKESAIDDLRKASVNISEEIGKAMGVKKPEETKYFDLTKGATIQTKDEFLSKSPFGKKFY